MIRYSFISALFLILLTYFVDSSPFPIGGEVSIGQWMDRIEYIITRNSDNVPDSVCLINVAYDKTLVEYEAKLYRDEEDSPTLHVGKIDVTDRDKLLKFLEIADSSNNYRYIMLDIRFDDDIKTDSITMKLFSQIKRMDRIVYAIHQDSEPDKDAPIEKAAFGDYHTTFLASDVVKYPVCKTNQDGTFISSMPARMYEELNHRAIMAYGWFTFDNGHLCVRSIYPSYPVRFYNWGKIQDPNQETVLQYFNLGEDFLNSPVPHDLIAKSIENRIVIIGDLVEDIHDTFYGQLPGALINFNAYIAICRGNHLINVASWILIFIMYFALSWSIIQKRSPIDYLPCRNRHRSKIIILIFSFIGYSFILTCYGIVVYLLFGSIYSVVIPGLYFTTLQTCVNLLK